METKTEISSPAHDSSPSPELTICRLPSGWVELYRLQFLPGYSILRADPVVSSLNDLDPAARVQFLADMALVGDVLMEVTGAYRINYAILGNTDPTLHAHIVPRYDYEKESMRKGLPWSYPAEVIDAMKYDLERDRGLKERIAAALERRSAGI